MRLCLIRNYFCLTHSCWHVQTLLGRRGGSFAYFDGVCTDAGVHLLLADARAGAADLVESQKHFVINWCEFTVQHRQLQGLGLRATGLGLKECFDDALLKILLSVGQSGHALITESHISVTCGRQSPQLRIRPPSPLDLSHPYLRSPWPGVDVDSCPMRLMHTHLHPGGGSAKAS